MSICMRRSPIPTVIAMTSITAMITRRRTRPESPTAIRTAMCLCVTATDISPMPTIPTGIEFQGSIR
jgi:hypothetical protein